MNRELPKYFKQGKIDFAENTNPYGPPVEVRKIFKKIYEYVAIYPDYKNIDINDKIAKFFKVDTENVAVTNGSLEPIFILPEIMKKENYGTFIPTYWGFEAACKRIGKKCNVKKLNIVNENYDEEEIRELAKRNDMIYVCNPNNPTGTFINKMQFKNIISENKKCHFIVDESHLLMSELFEEESLSKDIGLYDNLSLVYSVSKLYNIPGLRVGILISNSSVIKKFKEWQVPYSLNIIAQVLLGVCLEQKKFLEESIIKLKKEKKRFYKKLTKISFIVPKYSNANFILCELTRGVKANYLTELLLGKKIIIRNLTESYSGLDGEWIRISLNNKKNNEILFEELYKIDKIIEGDE